MQILKSTKHLVSGASATKLARTLPLVCVLFTLLLLPRLAGAIPFGAIACVTSIDLNGNSIVIDSFDSSDPAYSTWITNRGYGIYPSGVSNKIRANGNVTTDSSVIGAINIGSALIFGRVDTGPGGSVTIAPNGYVGPWPQSGTGIQAGYASSDMYVEFPDKLLPTDAPGWLTISDNIINLSGNYSVSGINNSLTINASNVNLYVSGSINLNSSRAITLGTNVSSVTIYVSGPSISVTANGAINNLTQNASILKIYGLPTVTNISLINNAAFIGSIYAPSANTSFGGGGNSTQDLVGRIVARSVVFYGKANFHFDEALAVSTSFPIWAFTSPPNYTVLPGTNVAYSVSTQGGGVMSYQWFFNQTNLLVDATNASLTLTNVQASDAGLYSAVLTNLFGSVTSSARLTVITNLTTTMRASMNATNGQFKCTTLGVTGFKYIIQASTNLSDWTSLKTNVSPFLYTETNSASYPQRFYRSIYVP